MAASSSLPILLAICPNSKYSDIPRNITFFVGEVLRTWLRKLYEYPLYIDAKEEMTSFVKKD